MLETACYHCVCKWHAGTHDNETTVGWWKDSAQPHEKDYIKQYLNTNGKDISGDFMRESFKSVSRTAIVMLQVSRQHLVSCYYIISWHRAMQVACMLDRCLYMLFA